VDVKPVLEAMLDVLPVLDLEPISAQNAMLATI